MKRRAIITLLGGQRHAVPIVFTQVTDPVAAVAGAADDLVTDCFAAAALTVVFVDYKTRFSISKIGIESSHPGGGRPTEAGGQAATYACSE
jgi:hypothetical protein